MGEKILFFINLQLFGFFIDFKFINFFLDKFFYGEIEEVKLDIDGTYIVIVKKSNVVQFRVLI